jgi:hypothetical protein
MLTAVKLLTIKSLHLLKFFQIIRFAYSWFVRSLWFVGGSYGWFTMVISITGNSLVAYIKLSHIGDIMFCHKIVQLGAQQFWLICSSEWLSMVFESG